MRTPYIEEEVPCTACGASADQPCVTGEPAPGRPTQPHNARRRDWLDHSRALAIGKRRMKVSWTTTEVLEWTATLAVPDDVADDEIEDYFADGNCPTLIDYENPQRKTYLAEFTRQLTELEPAP